MVILGLALVKFLLYFAVCVQAPRFLHVTPGDRAGFALSWAFARMGLGLLIAYPVFLIVAFLQTRGVPFQLSYVGLLLLARVAIWYFVCRAILSRHASPGGGAVMPWVALGVCASFAVDGLAYFAGAENFKFFC